MNRRLPWRWWRLSPVPGVCRCRQLVQRRGAAGGVDHYRRAAALAVEETIAAELRQNRNTAQAFKEHTLRIIATADRPVLRCPGGRARRLAGQPSDGAQSRETGMSTTSSLSSPGSGRTVRLVSSDLRPDEQPQRAYRPERARSRTRPPATGGAGATLCSTCSPRGCSLASRWRVKSSGYWTFSSPQDHRTRWPSCWVVVASLNQNYFMEVYGVYRLGHAGGVVLAGLDGVIRGG